MWGSIVGGSIVGGSIVAHPSLPSVVISVQDYKKCFFFYAVPQLNREASCDINKAF